MVTQSVESTGATRMTRAAKRLARRDTENSPPSSGMIRLPRTHKVAKVALLLLYLT